MTKKEWESLCDGCGRCCLNKFEDEDGTVDYTDVACTLLDCDSARCSNYAKRTTIVKDCIVLTPDNLDELNYMPLTCAYRRLNEGKDLSWWHPLVSGSPNTVFEAGISVAGKVIPEDGMHDREMENRIVRWPMSNRAKSPGNKKSGSKTKPVPSK